MPIDDAVVVDAPITAPVVAPVVAPVAAPVVAPVAPVIPVADTVPEIVTFDPTGDAGLDVALSFVGALGISGEHPALVAAGEGDFSIIKAHLATLGSKAQGWEQMVALAEEAFGRVNTAKTAAAAQVTSMVHEIAGGEAQWGEVLTWAGANADPAEKEQLNALFDSGPMGARAAATLLTSMFRSSAGTTITPATATRTQAGSSPLNTSGPLSPKDYAAAVRELRTKLGNSIDASPEYAALQARLRR